MTSKNKKSILFINPEINGHKIEKIYTKSFHHLLKYLKKHEEINKVFMHIEDFSLGQVQELLLMGKKIALIPELKAEKIIQIKQS